MNSNDRPTEVGSQTQESERRFRSIAGLSPYAIANHDLDGQVVCVKLSFCATLGYSRDEMLSMHPLDFEVNDSEGHVSALWRKIAPSVPVLI